ncbi:glucosamine-6-phosphate deaminase [Corynebacterium callunae]|uniref:Glucosamine-6-phosphate deaminase n=1 Tax=Corynebacterium callunae DSM 20147 TaxID=1121353 RepID=M1UN44_9CORY|nr:glucosamine-6-phosphate deaminase [Corynebacterium callunae]AGG67654.1 glucosamine-6-phosphate isomerase [Corynebacterium callunae DSM 20147]
MRILIRKNNEAVGQSAAQLMSPFINRGATLGLATGSTPLSTYAELIRLNQDAEISFQQCQAFLLDEYVGISRTDPNSYYQTIRDTLTSHIDIADDRVFSPAGDHGDSFAAAQAYENQVSGAGVDIQILGIGANGHIGFNEPSSSLSGLTKVQALHPKTVADNARFFASENEVPTHAITQGLGTISRAKNILLLAVGESKAQAIAQAVEGPVSASCPASILQMHPAVTVIIDEAAASRLDNVEYYRHVEQANLNE